MMETRLCCRQLITEEAINSEYLPRCLFTEAAMSARYRLPRRSPMLMLRRIGLRIHAAIAQTTMAPSHRKPFDSRSSAKSKSAFMGVLLPQCDKGVRYSRKSYPPSAPPVERFLSIFWNGLMSSSNSCSRFRSFASSGPV